MILPQMAVATAAALRTAGDLIEGMEFVGGSRAPLSPLAILIYCGVLMSISSFAIDITLPAFPEMVDRLGAPYATIQWTVTAYMFRGRTGAACVGARPPTGSGVARSWRLACRSSCWARS